MNHRLKLIALAMVAVSCGGRQANIDDEKQEELPKVQYIFWE